jgi:hypothetical protein
LWVHPDLITFFQTNKCFPHTLYAISATQEHIDTEYHSGEWNAVSSNQQPEPVLTNLEYVFDFLPRIETEKSFGFFNPFKTILYDIDVQEKTFERAEMLLSKVSSMGDQWLQFVLKDPSKEIQLYTSFNTSKHIETENQSKIELQKKSSQSQISDFPIMIVNWGDVDIQYISELIIAIRVAGRRKKYTYRDLFFYDRRNNDPQKIFKRIREWDALLVICFNIESSKHKITRNIKSKLNKRFKSLFNSVDGLELPNPFTSKGQTLFLISKQPDVIDDACEFNDELAYNNNEYIENNTSQTDY